MGHRHSAETRRRIGTGVRAATRKRVPLEARFWAKVEKTDGCWLWTGTPMKIGYGTISNNGRPLYAHRVSYELNVGPIPNGLHIDHLCFNKLCVNPAHLEPVTLAENVRRWAATVTHCPNGHRYPEGKPKQCRQCDMTICPECGGPMWKTGSPNKTCRPCRVRAHNPSHGTVSRYKSRRCRCVECRAANAAYERARKVAA